MKTLYKLKQLHENKHNIELDYIKENEIHEIGSTYFSGYLRETYTVTDIQINGSWTFITVLCSDNRTATHSTRLDHLKDFKVITNKGQKQWNY